MSISRQQYQGLVSLLPSLKPLPSHQPLLKWRENFQTSTDREVKALPGGTYTSGLQAPKSPSPHTGAFFPRSSQPDSGMFGELVWGRKEAAFFSRAPQGGCPAPPGSQLHSPPCSGVCRGAAEPGCLNLANLGQIRAAVTRWGLGAPGSDRGIRR